MRDLSIACRKASAVLGLALMAAPAANAEPVSPTVLEDILWRSAAAHLSARTFAAFIAVLPDGVRARAARRATQTLAAESYVPPISYPDATEFADAVQLGSVSAAMFEGFLGWNYSVFNGGGTVVEDLDAYIVHAGAPVRHDDLWILPASGRSVYFSTAPMELADC